MHYYRARYYDPSIGRFITEDPSGFYGGMNFYAYVFNNPINYTDPSGHEAATIAIGGGLILTGGGAGTEPRLLLARERARRLSAQVLSVGELDEV